MEQYIEKNRELRENILPELEAMRNQINLLKHKLDTQAIIGSRLLKESMKSRLRDINGRMWLSVAVCIAAIALCSLLFVRMQFSPVFVAVTDIMLVFSGAMSVFYHRKLLRERFLEDSLLDAANELQLLKKRYGNWMRYAFPGIVAWFVWLVAESYGHLGELALPFSTGALTGGVLGGWFGARSNRETVRKTEELLEEIRRVREGE